MTKSQIPRDIIKEKNKVSLIQIDDEYILHSSDIIQGEQHFTTFNSIPVIVLSRFMRV